MIDALNESRVKLYTWLVEPVFEDPRTDDWPLADWQLPLLLCVLYALAIPLGVRLMRDREPFNIKKFVIFHNLLLFTLSLYMAVETFRQAYTNLEWRSRGFTFYGNVADPLSPDGGKTFSKSGRALANVLYIHYISKAYEFVDTLIMVLKKSNRQISMLHVYHHATTLFPCWWAVIRYAPGGDTWYTAFLNSFIHVLMYGYYLASTFGLRLTFLKPMITASQILQFVSFISQGGTALYLDCYRPRLLAVLQVFQCFVFMCLFINFFIKTYIFKPKASKQKTT